MATEKETLKHYIPVGFDVFEDIPFEKWQFSEHVGHNGYIFLDSFDVLIARYEEEANTSQTGPGLVQKVLGMAYMVARFGKTLGNERVNRFLELAKRIEPAAGSQKDMLATRCEKIEKLKEAPALKASVGDIAGKAKPQDSEDETLIYDAEEGDFMITDV